MNKPSQRNRGGFSAIELVVVTAIIGLMLVIGLPALETAVRRARIQGTVRQLSSMMAIARLQAIKRGNNVVLWLSTTSSDATYRTAVVFDDPNSNGVQDTGEVTLLTYTLPPDKLGVHLHYETDGAAVYNSANSVQFDGYSAALGATSAGLNDRVIFTPSGSVLQPDTTAPALGIYLSDSRSNLFRVGIDNVTTAKMSIGKWDGTTYSAPPWKWN